MASRDIANMHVFLEMKRKFPNLPEDTLRNFIFLYANDQEKCIHLLEKKSRSFHLNQPFADAGQQDTDSTIPNKNNNPETSKGEPLPANNSKLQSNSDSKLTNPDDLNHSYPMLNIKSATGRSCSHAGDSSPAMSPVKSAPVITNSDRPFSDMYRLPSSQSAVDQRMMFSTTREHRILPPNLSESESKRQSVSLSIIPSFPFQQQQQQANTTVCTVSSSQASSSPGRHTTSVNFQLQPRSPTHQPIQISSVPTSIGSPCNFQDFGSHVQISVGSQGATFTALRLHRPQQRQQEPSVSYSFCQSPASPQSSPKSQAARDILLLEPERNRTVLNFDDIGGSDSSRSITGVSSEAPLDGYLKSGNMLSRNLATGFGHGFQASPDYILAVKKHQMAQLDLLQEELNKEKESCSKLRTEVDELEEKSSRRREKANSFSYDELLKKVKDENRELRIEVNCLFMEYDAASKGQIPVGVTDEDFYSNIFTGPNDGFTLNSNDKIHTNEDPGRRSPREEEEEDERNKWRCKKCTFFNHPALEKCEMCELSRNEGLFFES